jgi:hypothetical protein
MGSSRMLAGKIWSGFWSRVNAIMFTAEPQRAQSFGFKILFIYYVVIKDTRLFVAAITVLTLPVVFFVVFAFTVFVMLFVFVFLAEIV